MSVSHLSTKMVFEVCIILYVAQKIWERVLLNNARHMWYVIVVQIGDKVDQKLNEK